MTMLAGCSEGCGQIAGPVSCLEQRRARRGGSCCGVCWLCSPNLPAQRNPWAGDSDSVGLGTLATLPDNCGYPSFRPPQALLESSRIFRISEFGALESGTIDVSTVVHCPLLGVACGGWSPYWTGRFWRYWGWALASVA